jgi:F0F1-type ATP synthase assembly protein I
MDMTVHPTGPPSISVGAIVGIIAMHRSWTKPLGLLQLFFSGLA